MTRQLALAVIWGSGRPQGRGAQVAEWVLANIPPEEWLIDPIALTDYPLPASLETSDPTVKQWHTELSERVASADAFLFVFPEFNHSLPGALKVFVDSFHGEWRAKAAAMVTYGGMSGGIRAAEALRLIAAELHLHVVRDAVVFPKIGALVNQPEHPLWTDNVGALDSTLRQLKWWGQAVKSARESEHTPYPR